MLRMPRSRTLALDQISILFGYVPKLFHDIWEDDFVRIYSAMLGALLANSSTHVLPSTTCCKVAALAAYSYNCPYLMAVYILLAAQ